ncbi:uncharacterized protein LOC131172948 [Hevea brasiliensis]|uniref:uncharacterized protein LOC131172948 n=1 Tax=Hevea brasiliensis TaxID=3981 RepID=UPI0025E59803|nr:uncharacterized protein LOC131172948 [Hevea brasiliensis]
MSVVQRRHRPLQHRRFLLDSLVRWGRHSGRDLPIRQQSTGFLPSRQCETCGKNHGGICYKAIGACYNCGGTGHFAKDCTSSRRVGPPPTTAEGSVQSPVTRSSQPPSRGRGRGRGNPAGSQGTVKQSEQDSAPVRVYAMRQREEAETSDVVAGREIDRAAD